MGIRFYNLNGFFVKKLALGVIIVRNPAVLSSKYKEQLFI